MNWAVNEERKYQKEALQQVLSGPHANDPEAIWDLMSAKLSGIKQSEKLKQKAADKGTRIHDLICAYTNDEDVILIKEPPEIKQAVEAFVELVEREQSVAQETEQVIWSAKHRYAGRFDVVLLREPSAERITARLGSDESDGGFDGPNRRAARPAAHSEDASGPGERAGHAEGGPPPGDRAGRRGKRGERGERGERGKPDDHADHDDHDDHAGPRTERSSSS